MHEELLNFMLAHTCHNEKVGAGVTRFTFDLHCMEVEVLAQFVGSWDADPADVRYEILSWSAKEV